MAFLCCKVSSPRGLRGTCQWQGHLSSGYDKSIHTLCCKVRRGVALVGFQREARREAHPHAELLEGTKAAPSRLGDANGCICGRVSMENVAYYYITSEGAYNFGCELRPKPFVLLLLIVVVVGGGVVVFGVAWYSV